jgi:hypothetical protein
MKGCWWLGLGMVEESCFLKGRIRFGPETKWGMVEGEQGSPD